MASLLLKWLAIINYSGNAPASEECIVEAKRLLVQVVYI